MRMAGIECRGLCWVRGWTGRALTTLVLAGALQAAGCAAGARSDFDLNRDQATSEGKETAETASIQLGDVFPQLGAQPDSTSYVYRVREGDQLEIVFFSHPEQNRFVRVRPDGRITLPYLGDVTAARKSTTDLAREIQTSYRDVLVSPRVDVIVQEGGGRFYVLGQVRRPGDFPYARPLGLIEAVASAGGYDEKARLSHVVLLRRDDEGRTWAGIFDFRDFMDAETRVGNIAVRPDDIVWIPKSAISRWNDVTTQALGSILNSSDAVVQTWSIARFDDVYVRRF